MKTYKSGNVERISSISFQLCMKYSQKRGKNPLDKQGYLTQCHNCCSINHWSAECPDKDVEVGAASDTLYSIVLFEDDEENPDNIKSLVYETMGCAVLDCGAAKTVCGKVWWDAYRDALSEEDKASVVLSKSSIMFKFGNGNKVKSLFTVQFPIVLGSKKSMLQVEVVDEDLPLLFSRASMHRAKAQLDTSNDLVTMIGEKIRLITTSTGHYAVPITTNKVVCLHYTRPPPRSVESVPVATRFNQTVALELSFMEGKPVLHMIDALTRFSVSSVIRSKEANVIIESIFKNWITIFGVPGMFISDYSGEFANCGVISMGEAFNIRVVTTASESAWANGLCKKYNAVLGEMVNKILEEVSCSLEVAVAWANSAKNALRTVHGFSPAQLVFGFNPMLPCVQNDKPPALSTEEAYSDLVEENLRAMKKARVALVQADSSERIRRALNRNIRSTGDVKYIHGDAVYYKMKDDSRWHGPGTVIGQDGQFVLVRHQFTWIRVHPCRLQLIPWKKHPDILQKSEAEERPEIDTEERTEESDENTRADRSFGNVEQPGRPEELEENTEIDRLSDNVVQPENFNEQLEGVGEPVEEKTQVKNQKLKIQKKRRKWEDLNPRRFKMLKIPNLRR